MTDYKKAIKVLDIRYSNNRHRPAAIITIADIISRNWNLDRESVMKACCDYFKNVNY